MTKQARKEKWERERVQRVLYYHNNKYGASIEIKGKTIEVYPHLEGQLNWDWVCYDTRTGDEIALEVKKLTDAKSEERVNIVWQLLKEVSDNLLGRVPGIFSLSIDIPKGYYLPLTKQNKHELRDLLCKVIYDTAKSLKLKEEKDLQPEIFERLSFKLPSDCFFALTKLIDEGSAIYKSSGIIGWDSNHFDNSELKEFEQLVSQANIQLRKANVKETFLVLIEEGHRHKDPPAVMEAFINIDAVNYSDIRHVYFVRGKETAEISLPTSLD